MISFREIVVVILPLLIFYTMVAFMFAYVSLYYSWQVGLIILVLATITSPKIVIEWFEYASKWS